jgi:hypothetical protein
MQCKNKSKCGGLSTAAALPPSVEMTQFWGARGQRKGNGKSNANAKAKARTRANAKANANANARTRAIAGGGLSTAAALPPSVEMTQFGVVRRSA